MARAGLKNTALVQDWTGAAERALRDAPHVNSPYAEEGYLAPAEPAAIAFRITVRRGQEVVFEVRLLVDSLALLFVDAWEVEEDGAKPLEHAAIADSGKSVLTLEPKHDAVIILRAQPELLRGGRFKVSLRLAPTLAFPVQGAGERAIASAWGAPRDGGARAHQGIDIFVPRGTPAVAAAGGVITRVEKTPRGGNVVWLRDARGNSIYYAHLERQAVSTGQHVSAGEILGFVGNTGNAITTPPHLHFGVYRRGEGPLDPYWFVHHARGELARLSADTALLGDWARTANERTMLRRAPNPRAESLFVVPRHTALRIVAAIGSWYHVRLPDGATGYVPARLTEPADRPVEMTKLPERAPLLAHPRATASPSDVLAEVTPGESVGVLARFGAYLLVLARGGTAGWVSH